MNDTTKTSKAKKLLGVTVIALFLATPASSQLSISMVSEEFSTRLSHAKELLGQHEGGVALTEQSEIGSTFDEFVHQRVAESLQGTWKKKANIVSQTILEEAKRYRFDPVFLMSVIAHESSFKPWIRGTHGEIGMMQILPETGAWVARKYDLPWKDESTFKDPSSNIRIGAAYLSYLREMFRAKGKLYLAAYNMGAGNVQKNLAKRRTPQTYATAVIEHYVRFYTELKEDSASTRDLAGSVAKAGNMNLASENLNKRLHVPLFDRKAARTREEERNIKERDKAERILFWPKDRGHESKESPPAC